MPLLDIWRDSEESVLNMTIQQIVSTAGEGQLKDGSLCAEELREFLENVETKHLEVYANSCLEDGFPDSGFVLQDIVNEAGRRLGFEIEHGLYRGKPNRNGADGFWQGDGWSFVVEVKTTDTYAIKLNKIASYRSQYENTEQAQPTSCLIVVGRQDTATLEDQLRGSRHNWEMRIVGVEALFTALELKESSEDPGLSKRLIELFKPQEFTRIDQILSTAFDFATDREDFATDREDSFDTEENQIEDSPAKEQQARHYVLDKERIAEFKLSISKRIEKKYSLKNLNRNRSSFESHPKGHRFIVAVSKPYKGGKTQYWYSYYPRQINYLNEVENAYCVFGCLDSQKAFSIPASEMNRLVELLNTTTPKDDEDRKYYHVRMRQEGDRYFIRTPKNQGEYDISEFEI